MKNMNIKFMLGIILIGMIGLNLGVPDAPIETNPDMELVIADAPSIELSIASIGVDLPALHPESYHSHALKNMGPLAYRAVYDDPVVRMERTYARRYNAEKIGFRGYHLEKTFLSC